MEKLKVLQIILDNAGLKRTKVEHYDFTQSDDIDELYSGGIWDFSYNIARELLDNLYENESVSDRELDNLKDRVGELLYNLFSEYRTETNGNK